MSVSNPASAGHSVGDARDDSLGGEREPGAAAAGASFPGRPLPGCTGREFRVRSRPRAHRPRPSSPASLKIKAAPMQTLPVLDAAGDSRPRCANFPGRAAGVLHGGRCPGAGSARRDGARDRRGRDAELLARHSATRQGVARTPGDGDWSRAAFPSHARQRYRKSRASGTRDVPLPARTGIRADAAVHPADRALPDQAIFRRLGFRACGVRARRCGQARRAPRAGAGRVRRPAAGEALERARQDRARRERSMASADRCTRSGKWRARWSWAARSITRTPATPYGAVPLSARDALRGALGDEKRVRAARAACVSRRCTARGCSRSKSATTYRGWIRSGAASASSMRRTCRPVSAAWAAPRRIRTTSSTATWAATTTPGIRRPRIADKIRQIAATLHPYPWEPGTVMRYRDQDYYLLGAAIQGFLKSVRGPQADLGEMVQNEVLDAHRHPPGAGGEDARSRRPRRIGLVQCRLLSDAG